MNGFLFHPVTVSLSLIKLYYVLKYFRRFFEILGAFSGRLVF